ncbi:hypothetical protein [Asticcacaulis sp. AC402]|uniref:hypothetical protein n=1 Tax=Asticcacaulis sp. AC402 TaxID=1282361 RepID=UPI0003C3FFF7|nr:hypothetical protein [Asticcacaulis sp. AC402]ESQ75349.1 hypothetical protein ABAC402_09600 [Asticcacaulis sp. AC402]
MGYSIHIERIDASGQLVSIELHEVANAVKNVEGMRLAAVPASTTNPNTGEVISTCSIIGKIEIYLLASDEWVRVFILSSSGKITFRAPFDFDDGSSVVRSFARILAQRLQAVIVGDEGEYYT